MCTDMVRNPHLEILDTPLNPYRGSLVESLNSTEKNVAEWHRTSY